MINMRLSTTIRENKTIKYLLISSFFVIFLSIFSLFTGAYDINNSNQGWYIFRISRISRTLAVMLTGASISICGLTMQILTRNKMVDSTTTGTVEWAELGLMFSYIFISSPTIFERTFFSIIFSFIGTIIFFMLIKKIKIKSSLVVPIVGIMLGAVISSISTFISLMFNARQTISVWFSASFSNIESGRYEILWIVVFFTAILFIFADKITLAGLGEDISKSLGLNYEKIIIIATILISLNIGIVSSVIGNIPFLGLIVPNIVSKIIGDNLKTNLPLVTLVGMSILLAADILAKTVISPFEIPVSLVMGILGAFVFLIIIIKKRLKNEK